MIGQIAFFGAATIKGVSPFASAMRKFRVGKPFGQEKGHQYRIAVLSRFTSNAVTWMSAPCSIDISAQLQKMPDLRGIPFIRLRHNRRVQNAAECDQGHSGGGRNLKRIEQRVRDGRLPVGMAIDDDQPEEESPAGWRSRHQAIPGTDGPSRKSQRQSPRRECLPCSPGVQSGKQALLTPESMPTRQSSSVSPAGSSAVIPKTLKLKAGFRTIPLNIQHPEKPSPNSPRRCVH